MVPFEKDNLHVDPRKIRDYLLAPDHPQAAGKAAFFATLGFDRARPWELADELRSSAVAGTVSGQHRTPHGTKYVVDGRVRGRRVRTVWIVDPPSSTVRLVTAYPIRRRR
jgi:hypothetical protein